MNYNYHAHTTRCSHASGTPEEYILRAIENGVKYMGFSEHAPYVCPTGQESSYRVPMADAKDYIADIAALREKYKDQIELKIGFEMEYYPQEFEKMLATVVSYGAEYLILGEHFTRPEYPDGVHVGKKTEDVELLKEYVMNVIEAMETDVFTYVAHPDVIEFIGDTDIYETEMRKICEASKRTGIPLEINFLGIRTNRNYPDERFWRIAGEVKSPVTFGFDAHSAVDAYDGASFVKAQEMVKTYGLNYVGMPKVKELRK